MKEGQQGVGFSYIEKHKRVVTATPIDWEDVGLMFAAQLFYSGETLKADLVNKALDFLDEHRDEIRGSLDKG